MLARSSTLRTIDEGESPYGSYISRSSSFPPRSPGILGRRQSSGRKGNGSRDRDGCARKESIGDLVEDSGEELDLDSASRLSGQHKSTGKGKGRATTENGQEDEDVPPTPGQDAESSSLILPSDSSPSPSPGRISRRRARVQAGEASTSRSTSSSPTTSHRKSSKRARRGSIDDPRIQDQINQELGIRAPLPGRKKGKGKMGEVMQLEASSDSSDQEDDSKRIGRILHAEGHDRGGVGRRRMEVIAYNADVDPDVGHEGEEVGIKRRGRGGRKADPSGETTLVGSNASASGSTSVSSSRSPSPSPDRHSSISPSRIRNRKERKKVRYNPTLATNPNETSSLLGPLDSKYHTDGEAVESDIEEVLEGGEQQEPGVWYKGPLFEAGWKLGLMFLLFTGVIVGVGWGALPRMER